MKTQVIFVTPDMARNWLEKNGNNRNVREHKVRKFCEDLKHGRFKLTHQGIAFGKDGELIDGQHRLMAIARTGIGALMMVTTGLTDDTVLCIDRGSPRAIHDNARMLGFEVSQTSVSVAFAAMACPATILHSTSASEDEVIEFIRRRAEAFKFIGKAKKKSLTRASVMAAFVRAYPHCDTTKLERCLNLFLDGIDASFNAGTEMAITSFRDYCLKSTLSYGYKSQLDLYHRAQRAIKAFMDGEPLKLIKPCSSDLFPIVDPILL
jgi:hypothetical protein